MPLQPLVLEPASPSLWADFQAQRELPATAPDIVGCWRRARALGASEAGPRPEDVLLRGEELRLRIQRLEPLLWCGQRVFEHVTGRAAKRDFSLLLSDAEGVIVQSAGGGAFAESARQVRLMEGANWHEAVRGTNAIGTAIAERRPVFVCGGAHYARPYQRLVCYAAPIVGVDGELIAVVDATSHVQCADASVGVAVVDAARAIEELLRARAYSRAGASVARALVHALDRIECPSALIEPPGRVARLNRAGRELLGGAPGDLNACLGLSFAELTRAAQGSEREPEVMVRGGRYRVVVEPLESEGRRIALLAFLEPVRTPKPRAVAATVQPEPSRGAFAELFAEDRATRASIDWVQRIAPSDVPIILLAETGSGKELMAQGIHRASHRAKGPFVTLNCGSLASGLLESELFGYAPGAFSGADRRGRHGYLEAASGGTLFLDEVADMPLGMQAALLRVLEDGSFQRVGDPRARRADVRVVCATCRPLPELVARGHFRSDLYFRLKGTLVTLPPLRRRTDVLSLASHLLCVAARRRGRSRPPALSPEVQRSLSTYPWPGNVRELQSVLDVALVVVGDATRIELGHLPPDFPGAADPAAGEAPDAPRVADEPGPPPRASLARRASEGTEPRECTEPRGASLAELQSHEVQLVLAEAAGNVTRAAKRLGVARSTVYRMMRRYGLRSG